MGLPAEVWVMILLKLSVVDRCNFYYASKKFRHLLQDPKIWRIVDLSRVSRITFGMWQVLKKCAGNYVQRLTLTGQISVASFEEPLCDMITCFSNVTYLDVSGCDLMTSLNFISEMKSLKILLMDYCHLDILSCVLQDNSSDSLRHFSYRGNTGSVWLDVKFLLHGMPNLTFLDVTGMDLWYPHQVSLIMESCTKLKKFYFNCKYEKRDVIAWCEFIRAYQHVHFSHEFIKQMKHFLKC